MLLCKVMMGKASDVESIVSGKVALKHEGRNIDSIRAVAKAYKDRSLHGLETALKECVCACAAMRSMRACVACVRA